MLVRRGWLLFDNWGGRTRGAATVIYNSGEHGCNRQQINQLRWQCCYWVVLAVDWANERGEGFHNASKAAG